MRTPQIALMVATFCSGLFTGLMLTFVIVIEPVLGSLSASDYTRVMQQLIHHADNPPIVPAMVILTVLAGPVALYGLRRQRSSPPFVLTLIGWLIFVAGVFYVTVGLNVRINMAILGWSIASPPADWMQARDHWNQFNLIRTPASGLSFLSFLLALASEKIHEASFR